MNQIKFSSIPLKVQEHSLTINPVYYFQLRITANAVSAIKHYIKPNTTLDLSLTTI